MTTITVYAPGHYDYADSYGLIACQLVRHLSRLGVRVNAVGLGRTVMESQPPDVRAVTEQPIQPSFGGVVLGYPTGYAYQSQLLFLGPRVALAMFESSRIPSAWVEPLNDCDAVIVPSTFCRDVFQACGVTAPVHVVPLGVSEAYKPAPRDTDGRPLTFLAFMDRGARKGGVVALQAFLRAFGDSMDYRLILKTRTPKVPLQLTNANVEVVQRDMTEQELCELYQRADVLVNPHKGEGYGMIPREAAACGCITLTTAWSGTVDDLDQWGWPLPYTLERADWKGARIFDGLDLGEWAAPDVDGVANVLRDVAANVGRYRAQAQANAENVRRLYSWPAFAAQVLDIWEGVAIGNRIGMAAA